MKAYLTLTLIAAAAMASGCRQHTADADDSADTRIEMDCITGSYSYQLDGSASDYMRDRDIQCFDSASIIIPEHIAGRDIAPLRDSILSLAFDTIAEPAEAMRTFFAAHAARSGYPVTEIADTVSAGLASDGLMLVDGSIINLSPVWLTYCITTSVSEPGAAHGLTVKRYLNYSIAEGRLITLDTIFTPDGIAALPELIARQARKLRPVLGDTSIDAIPADGNFIAASDGTIIFAYRPYEVASYAQGEIRVPFYAYQLSDLFTPTGLRLFNLDGSL